MAANHSRRIVITGCTRGLGRAMTLAFAERGHQVFGCGRQVARIDELRQRLGEPHRFDPVDVTDWPAVEAWAHEILTTAGPPDLLINNAAVMNPRQKLWLVPVDEFDRLIDVNIKGVAHVLRAFLPAMVESGQGVIVNFSSGWGRSTSADVAPYCASKFAIEGLTRALAQELPDGMAAVPLNPGIIDTDMLRIGFGEGAAAYPKPDRWAEVAVPFLLGLGPADNGKPRSVPT